MSDVEFEATSVDQLMEDTAKRTYRRSRRDANPTVQMSIRMPEDSYEEFRMLRARERRTNGDMLRVLMEVYEREPREERIQASQGGKGPSAMYLARLWLAAFRSNISRGSDFRSRLHRQRKPL